MVHLPTKKQPAPQRYDTSNPPESLDDTLFFGLDLDPEQKALRDAMWKQDKHLFFVSGAAGTGKDLVSIATAVMLVLYGFYSKIIYVRNAGEETKLGYLPGSLAEKQGIYSTPCAQALLRIGLDPSRNIINDGLQADASVQGGFVMNMSTSYLRGVNLSSEDDRTIVIIDEAQNFSTKDLKMTLTRVSDFGMTVVLGCETQIDLPRGVESGFGRYWKHFEPIGLASYHTLLTCHRGKIAEWADRLPIMN